MRFLIAFLLPSVLVAGRAGSVDPEIESSLSGGNVVEIAVVVHKKNSVRSLSDPALRRVFLRKQLKWPDGRSITVYDQRSGNPIRGQFSRLVFEKEPMELKEYWLNLKLTRGLRQPRSLPSSTIVKQYIRRVKGGIGYIYRGEVDDSVRVLKILRVVERKRAL